MAVWFLIAVRNGVKAEVIQVILSGTNPSETVDLANLYTSEAVRFTQQTQAKDAAEVNSFLKDQMAQTESEIQKATDTAVLSTEEVTKGVAAAMKVGAQAGDTIKTLADTGRDMSAKYKETSEAGLAQNLVLC